MEPVPTPRRRPRPRGLIAAAALLGLCLTAYTGISLYSADILTRPRNHPIRVDSRTLETPLEPWSTRTPDGLTLRGWYLRGEPDRPLLVLVHGMGDSRDHLLDLGSALNRRGFSTLLFDLRGHGESDPARLTMGRRERQDIRAVLAWAGRAGFSDDRIGWVGFSMGASTLLMEAAQNPRIRAAVLDSPFGDLPELLNAQLTRHSHLPSLFNPGILLAARFAYGVRTDDLIPTRSARGWGDRPIMLIHGDADVIVPVHHCREIARAIGHGCVPIILPGVGHVRAYRAQPDAYVDAVSRFFERHLGPGPKAQLARR